MKKTLSITLGGRVFSIEEDGFAALEAYLADLKRHFAGDDSADELLADIEAGLGEKFSVKIGPGHEAVTAYDVADAVRVMGNPEEIAPEADGAPGPGQEAPSAEPAEASGADAPKRLYRDTEDVVLGGVASGLAAYFGIDPVFLRVAFILLSFVNGIGALVYLVLWVAMPEAKTSAQKLEMRGRPVNVAEFQERVKERAREMGEEGKAAVERVRQRSAWRKVLDIPVRVVDLAADALRRIGGALGPVVRVVMGVGLLVFGTVAIAASAMAAAVLAFRIDSPYLVSDLPLAELAGNPLYFAGIAAGFVLVLIPLLFVVILGASAVRRKSQFHTATSAVLVGLWIAAAAVMAVAASDLLPWAEAQWQRVEQRPAASRVFPVSGFRRVRADGRMQVTVTAGDAYGVSVSGDSRSLSDVGATVVDGELRLGRKTGVPACVLCVFRPIQATVTLPALDAVWAEGASQVQIYGASRAIDLHVADVADLSMSLSGQSATATVMDGGSLRLDGTGEFLDLSVSGMGQFSTPKRLDLNGAEIVLRDAGHAVLEGSAVSLDADLGDAAHLEAGRFETSRVAAEARDMSWAHIFPVDLLNATSTDAAQIWHDYAVANASVKEFDHGRIWQEGAEGDGDRMRRR